MNSLVCSRAIRELLGWVSNCTVWHVLVCVLLKTDMVRLIMTMPSKMSIALQEYFGMWKFGILTDIINNKPEKDL